jgi:predicted enzyme related to lactoylglutathione lyase
MKRVTGIGGIFFKANSIEQSKLIEWYDKHLGIKADPQYGTAFEWRDKDDPQRTGMTTWSIFKHESKYFDQLFMVNYRVDDLDALLEALKAEGVEVDPKRENMEYGKFAWITDPDGNRIELWEPPKDSA